MIKNQRKSDEDTDQSIIWLLLKDLSRKVEPGSGGAFIRQTKLNSFFGKKQVAGPTLNQLHPEVLMNVRQ